MSPREAGSRLLASLMVLGCLGGCAGTPATSPPSESVKSGTPALVRSDRPLLIAFLDPAAPVGAASRSQIPVLRSMATQYGPAGLSVLIVDATGRASADSLTNFTHDWNLHPPSITVAAPNEAAAYTTAHGVTTVPDTVLLAPGGAVQQRWRGTVVTAQQLAPLLQAMASPTPSPSSNSSPR
ncbi:hypothetical protein [Streptomyces coerulescens]|uniref:Uncharacterized protein n=1 Tax=Streptomyces coerulescens TaxID=29304 RepID=A0ABW0D003_STRCD